MKADTGNPGCPRTGLSIPIGFKRSATTRRRGTSAPVEPCIAWNHAATGAGATRRNPHYEAGGGQETPAAIVPARQTDRKSSLGDGTGPLLPRPLDPDHRVRYGKQHAHGCDHRHDPASRSEEEVPVRPGQGSGAVRNIQIGFMRHRRHHSTRLWSTVRLVFRQMPNKEHFDVFCSLKPPECSIPY